MSDQAIEVRRLRKRYGGIERLHGVSFSVDYGEVFGFLGTNGAGKTTTIEILEGYRARDGGEVSVLGADPAHAGRDWRNRIGLVLQESELNPVYTVRETVAMFARYFRQPTDLDATIASAGLADKAGERVGRLSGGEKRRVDVAIGLVGDPEVLFLDEPTTGLDPAARRGMWALIEGLRRAGKTVFLTTHYMEEAQRLADRIVILQAGAIAAQGTAEQLSRALGHATRISFLAPPQIGLAQVSAAVGTPVEQDGRWLGFRSDQAQRDLTALLGWAAEHGVELTSIRVSPPTLDDVFVQLAVPAGGALDDGS
ncbi:MAG: ABC transporter ATP-binding protein [Streptosporangiaceae bacterium]